MSMNMSFWCGYIVDNFLFYGYNIKSIGAFVATCIGLGAMAMMFEFLKLLQAKQRRKELLIKSRQIQQVCPTEAVRLLRTRFSDQAIILSRRNRITLYCLDGLLWLCSFNLSYIIMLAVMAYNVWMTLAIITGGGLGYFVFGQSFMKINLQNCQTLRATYCVLNCGGESDFARNGESTPTVTLPDCLHEQPSSSNILHVATIES